jgi:nucleotide-binding universal stress UspA family protein
MQSARNEENDMPNTKTPYVIVVAVDYSEAGDLAFERALELAAEKPTAAVHVIHVLPFAPEATTVAWRGSLPTVSEAAATLNTYVEKSTDAFRAAHPNANLGFLADLRAHQRVEVPSEQVAQLAADLEADLVVVGTHGRRGFERFVLGSVAEATVRLAPCPVLVVRPKAAPPPVPAIQPPCPRCVEARKASNGKNFWCEQHSERHGQRHTYHQGDRVGADTNMPLVVHS